MNLAKHWTQTCLKSHEECNLDRPLQYPSRLLLITSCSVRLVATDDWTSKPDYATLSHSWGSKKFETLRLANLEQMRSCVPIDSLTKTFVDAIEITRAVGLDYLWIDSLCIIQDDHKDWEVQSAKMASVYGGSSLNIAASSAREGTEGCFPKPRSHSLGFMHEVCAQGRTEILEFMLPDWYEAFVSGQHLASRAWCVQEKILTPRTLHCGNHGLFWECRTARASEDFPSGFKSEDSITTIRLMHPDHAVPLDWNSVVTWYSECDLTYPEDKLVALSGIARSYMDKTWDEYFAGLWRHNLVSQLHWIARDPRPRPQYRAPSWSWAAVDGPIDFDTVHSSSSHWSTVYSRVHSVSIENLSIDTCGAVSHGLLILNCDVVLRGTVRMAPPGLAVGGIMPRTESWLQYADLGHKDHFFPFRLDCSEGLDKCLGQSVYFLPLGESGDCRGHYYDERGSEDVLNIFGLVVEEIGNLAHEYRRIGCFEYHSCETCHSEESKSFTFLFAFFKELLSIGTPGSGRIKLV